MTASGYSSEHDSVVHSSRPRQLQAIFRRIDEWLRQRRLIEEQNKNSHAYSLPKGVLGEKKPLVTVQYENNGDRYVELRFYGIVLEDIGLLTKYRGLWEKAEGWADAPIFSLEVSKKNREYKMGFNIEGYDDAQRVLKLFDPLLNEVDVLIESRLSAT